MRNLHASLSWLQYRGGSPKPVTLARCKPAPAPAPIVSKGKRDHLVTKVMGILADYQRTPFEHEGAIRSGIRQAFCLEGNNWSRSDDEAAALLSRAFKTAGAKRPSWDEGQLEHTVPRENCRWCRAPLAEENMTNGREHVFCSVVCAKSAYEYRQYEDGRRNDRISRQAHSMIARSRQNVRKCEQCNGPFQPRSEGIDQRFCSTRCSRAAWTVAKPLACTHCRKTFTPRTRLAHKHFCSAECARAHAAVKPQACPICSVSFHPTKRKSIFCSMACAAVDRKRPKVPLICRCCGADYLGKNKSSYLCSSRCKTLHGQFKRGKPPVRISALVFDFVFKMAA